VSALIVFVSTGLLFYWLKRVLLLFNGPRERVNVVLENDLWLSSRILVALRAMFFPAVADL
jgi:hypothetical protein